MEGGSETERLNEIGIIGAGIAGTALAVALTQAGLAVRLYEQVEAPEPPPADEKTSSVNEGAPPAATLIELTANGTRVLHALGLKQPLADIAIVPEFSTIRHAGSGFLLSQRPLGQFSEARYGAPSCLTPRAELVAMLREAARDHNIPMEYGHRVIDVDTARGTLTLDTGESYRHLAVAVATGRPGLPDQPGLANLLEPRRWHLPSDITLCRAVGERTAPIREHGRFINTWVHPGYLVQELPVSHAGGVQQVEMRLISAEAVSTGDPRTIFEALLEPLHTHLRTLVQNPDIEPIEVLGTDPAEHWHAGRMVMLGDVCHAHPAHPTQSDMSPCAALEDAWILSRMMERWEEAPHEGFADYERYRKPRARRLRAHADAELASLTLSGTSAVWRRNLTWSMTSRFLPEIAMQRLDWIYGYDCIKGFD